MVKAINSAFLALAVAAVSVNALTGHQPHFNGLNHRDLAGRRHAISNLEKKDLGERAITLPDPFPNTDTNTTGPTGSGDGGNGPTGDGSGGPGGSVTTTTTTSSTTSTTPTTTDPPPTTSDSSTSTSTTPTSTSSTPTTTSRSSATSTTQGTTILRANTGISYTNSAAVTSLRASTTGTSTDAAPQSTETPFLKNKTAVAATFTVVSIVGLGIIIFVIIWLKKKQQRGKMMEEDMWDEAGMTEFSRPPPEIPSPAPAVLAGGGLGRKNTVLPSQSAGAARPARSASPDPYGEEPDEILAVPPVANYERPRDSAFDIVPAAPPPVAGQYGDAMQPPRRGDHTSFGSGLGMDPFAGTGFVDATRDSTFGGSGQAGRGAGYNMGPYDQGHNGAGAVQMGNQWPQGYNPYTGYNQGGEDAYANYGHYNNAHGYAH